MDDEPFNLIGLSMILARSFKDIGVKSNLEDEIVDKACNGKEALDLVKTSFESKNSYGIIFMDCSMPIMDGYKSSKLIRNFYNKKDIE